MCQILSADTSRPYNSNAELRVRHIRLNTTRAALRDRMRQFFQRHSPGGDNVTKYNTGSDKSPLAHRTIAIFEHGLPFVYKTTSYTWVDSVV